MTTTGSARSDILRTTLWTIALLASLDLGLGLAFRVPADPRSRPSPLAQYFDFGTSTEAKLRRMVAQDDAHAAPVVSAGWLEPRDWPADDAPAAGRPLVTVYGQSFTYAIGESLGAIEPTWVFRARGGPAAPVSHLVALHDVDRRRVASDVAILGVLASSLRGVDATTGATWMFESPYPYTYPRWRLEGDTLRADPPSIRSLGALRAALADRAATRAWAAELQRQDAWYSPALFHASVLDHSVIVRLLRRAWAQRQQRGHLATIHDRQGFREASGIPEVTRRLIRRFAANARADGALPVVVLVHDRGYSDHLARFCRESLERDGIVFLSTHELADPGDPANFVGDGHLSGPANRRLALALHGRIVREQHGAGAPAAPVEPAARP